MTATEARVYRLGEFHRFEAGGGRFLYLVPAGAIFEVDQTVEKLIDCFNGSGAPHDRLIADLAARGVNAADAEELVTEMRLAGVLLSGERAPEQPQTPPADFPLQTLVMNLTNQCNLSCQYCYEFGADKVATPEGKPKFMDFETAKSSVDFLLAQSADRPGITCAGSSAVRPGCYACAASCRCSTTFARFASIHTSPIAPRSGPRSSRAPTW